MSAVCYVPVTVPSVLLFNPKNNFMSSIIIPIFKMRFELGFLLLRIMQPIMVEPVLELGQSDSRAQTLNHGACYLPRQPRDASPSPSSSLSSTRAPLFTTSYRKTHFFRTLKEIFRHGRLNKILLEKSAFLKSS